MCNNVARNSLFQPRSTYKSNLYGQLQSEDDEGNKISYKEMKNLYVAGIDLADIGQVRHQKLLNFLLNSVLL